MRRFATFAALGALGICAIDPVWSQTQPAPPPGAAPGSQIQPTPNTQPGVQPKPSTQPGTQPTRPAPLPGAAPGSPLQPTPNTQPGAQPAPNTQPAPPPGAAPGSPVLPPKQPMPGTATNQPGALPNPYPTGSFYPFGPPNLPPFFENPSVRKELNLTDQQVNQLNQSFQTLNATFANQFSRVNTADAALVQQLQQNFNAQLTNSLSKILQGQQLTRLQQLQLQQRGMAVFSDPAIQKSLNLSPEQSQRLSGLGDQVNREVREINRLAETNRSAARRRFTTWQNQWQSQLDDILTDQQQQMWTQMIGQRFLFEPAFDTAPQ
jgi:hypothetical protein